MPIISGSTSSGGGGKIPAAQIGASPPASPTDGMIWIFPADATNGVNWQFVYNSAETTYKWRFIGGPPMFISGAPIAVINTLTQVGATGNYYSTAFTNARAGDYLVQGTFEFIYAASASVATGTGQVFQGTTMSPNQTRGDQVTWTATNAQPISSAAAGVVTGVSASTTLGIAYGGSDVSHMQLRWYETFLLPIRVI